MKIMESEERGAKRSKADNEDEQQEEEEEADEMARGHPLSPYTHARPDFAALAEQHAPLRRTCLSSCRPTERGTGTKQ